MLCNETAESSVPPEPPILHLVSSLDPRTGGTAEGVMQLSAAARRQGHSIEIATLDAPGSLWGHDLGLPVHQLGPGRGGTYCYAPRLLPWLIANRPRFGAVIVNGLWQYHGFAAWLALRGTSTPYFVFPHGMLDPWFKRTFPLKHAKKWLYWPFGEYRILRDARAVLFTCEEERRQARESFWLYRVNEVVTTLGTPGPGISDPDAQREAFLQRFPQLRNQRLLLFLGRMHRKKGCDLLLEAFASVASEHPAPHLVMAGPDPDGLQTSLASRISPSAATRITWTGMLEGDVKWGAFRAAEAFVLPSHQENFGIAVAEALACNVPVLVSRHVNIWREIDQAGAGLIDEDTRAGTLSLLRRWLDLDAHRRAVMAERAGQTFRNCFQIDAAALRLIDVVRSHPGHALRPLAA